MNIEYMEKQNFSYDIYSDSLIISNRQENEIVKKNFEVGDIVFSLTGKGKIVGIEIRGASLFFESCGLEQSVLNSLKNVAFNVIPRRGSIFLILKIESFEGEQTIARDIPLVMPLIN